MKNLLASVLTLAVACYVASFALDTIRKPQHVSAVSVKWVGK